MAVTFFALSTPFYRSFWHIIGTHSGTQEATRVDVACIRFLDSLMPLLQERYRFWDLEKLFDPTKLEIYNCCVYGFDEKRTDKQTLDATATANFAKLLSGKVFDNYQLKPEFHYIVESRGEGFDLHSGTVKKANITPHGMSGRGLWYVDYVQQGTTYIPRAYLIGILKEYRTGRHQCLIANRPLLIQEFIRNNLNDFLFPWRPWTDVVTRTIVANHLEQST